MVYDWHNTFGNWEGFHWWLVIVCFVAGISFYFYVQYLRRIYDSNQAKTRQED